MSSNQHMDLALLYSDIAGLARLKTGLTQKSWYENDSNLDILREMSRFKVMLDSS